MIIETEEVLERYDMSLTNLRGKAKLIKDHGGRANPDAKGSTKSLFKSSVLDKLARNGQLGSDAQKAMLNRDQRKKDELQNT